MIDNHTCTQYSGSFEIKPEKKVETRTGFEPHGLCDTGAVLYQLSYIANWELATLRIRNVSVNGEEYESII